jgi:hemoglobin
MVKYLPYIVIVCSLQFNNGCSSQKIEPKIQKKHLLYNEMGGQEGIENLVDAFIKRIPTDKEILPYFAKSSVKHFKEGFINHLCFITKGPCQYNGDSMVDIHTGMNITERDFNRVVEILIEAMEDIGISYQSQNRLLSQLAPLRGQVIKL